MTKTQIVRIRTKNKKSLDQGAADIADMLGEIERSLATKRERECPCCHDIIWMYPEAKVCWRCERIKEGLPVCKPKNHDETGHSGNLMWNYRLNAWVDEPPSRVLDLSQPLPPEWGKREEYADDDK